MVQLHNQVTGLNTAKGIGQGLSKVASWVIAAVGTGYVNGDEVTLAGGTFRIPAVLRVLTTNQAGNVLTLEKVNAGVATSKPSNAVSVTGGTGTGLTLTITWSDNAVPDGMCRALITVNGDVRMRNDGTNPTPGMGIHLSSLDAKPYEHYGPGLGEIVLVAEDGSATADVTFLSH